MQRGRGERGDSATASGSERVHLVAAVRLAARLLWAGSPVLFVSAMALQALSGSALAGVLLIADHLVRTILNTSRDAFGLKQAPYLLAIVVVAGGASLANGAQMAARKLLVERTIRYISGITLGAAAAVPLEELERSEFHDRLQRAQRYHIMAPLAVADGVFGLATTLFYLVGAGVAILLIAPLALPVVLAGAVPIWIAGARQGRAFFAFLFGESENDRVRFALSSTLLSRQNAKEVRAFLLFEFLKGRWDRLYQERIKEETRVVTRSFGRLAIGAGMAALALAATLVLLSALVAAGQLTVASSVTGAVAVVILSNRLATAGASIQSIFEYGRHLEDFDELASLAHRGRASHHGSDPGPFSSVELRSVSFRYPEGRANALEDIDFRIEAGEVVALVGENGSGKTTLAKLVCCLYRPTAGTVAWSGQDVAELDRTAAWEQIAPIFQDFARYPLTAKENIAVGRIARIDDEDGVHHAAHQAGVLSLLQGLPKGLDTLLMKELTGGTDLSGGEWQKVALARAFFRDAPLIVLDEPTASLDAQAEHEVFTSVRSLAQGRAVLLISHRFSTVRSADRIVVIHQGRIVEQGSHEELMAAKGRYHMMFTLQAEPYVGA